MTKKVLLFIPVLLLFISVLIISLTKNSLVKNLNHNQAVAYYPVQKLPADYQKGQVIVRFREPLLLKDKNKTEITRSTRNEIDFSEIDQTSIPPFLANLFNYNGQSVKKIKLLFKDKQNSTALKNARLDNIYIFTYDSNLSVIELVSGYKKLKEVDFAEPNYLGYPTFVPNDPDYSKQWSLPKIGAEQAWDIARGNNITVAVLDTGFDIDHPELADVLLPGYNFTSIPPGIDIRDNPDKPCGHGTHIAGIIAAKTNNNSGIAGLAFDAKILPVKVMDRYQLDSGCYGSYSDFADGIIYAVDNGAKVINMSFGATTDSQILRNAVSYAGQQGVVMVAAAGNLNSSNPFYPAYYEPVIAVAATDQDDNKASYSNYGSWIELSAPGSSIYSLWPWGSFTSMGGTSCSSPHVAALVAMILSQKPDLIGKPAEVLEILGANADDLGVAGKDDYFGYGRINAAKTLQSLLPMPTPTIPPPTGVISTNVKVSFEGRGTNNLRWIEGVNFKVFKTGQTKPFHNSIEVTSIYGTFTANPNFPSIPDAYDFLVKGRHSLSKKIISQFIDHSFVLTTLDFGTLLEGDVNGDDLVNNTDLNLLLLSLGKRKGDKGFNPQADLNVDNTVNLLDRSLLLKNFCKKGDGYIGTPPPCK